VAEKAWQEKYSRKIVTGKVRQKNRNRKSAAEKSLQKKCGNGFMTTKPRQKKRVGPWVWK
jgi:hypothetical protein